MAKQEELRALINVFAGNTQRQTALMYDHASTQEQREEAFKLTKVAEQRIFSFFDQMRKTIDGLVKTVESKDAISLGVIHDRDEAVRQVKGLYSDLMMAQGEMKRRMAEHMHEVSTYKKALEDRGTPVAEDAFAPFDPARNGEGLEVLVGMPGAGTWHAATYIGASPKGFHVVEIEGRGIIAVTDATVGLRHRVKAKTVTMYANLWRKVGGNRNTGVLYETEDCAIKAGESSFAFAHAAVPVKVTVAE